MIPHLRNRRDAAELGGYIAALTPPPDSLTHWHRRWRPCASPDAALPPHARRFVARLRTETEDLRWAIRLHPRGTYLLGLRERKAVRSAAPADTVPDVEAAPLLVLTDGFRLWREVRTLDPAILLWASLHHYRRAEEFGRLLDAQDQERQRDDARQRTDLTGEMASDAWAAARGRTSIALGATDTAVAHAH